MGRGARPAPARSLKARAIQLLAQREHSRIELRRKLLAHALVEVGLAGGNATGQGVDSVDSASDTEPDSRVHGRLDALLDWLEANQYLSNQRFIESRVHARASRYGNLRIRLELAQHDTSLPADVESALKQTEFARARTVWERKFSGPPADGAERARQSRFLAGRGFSGEVIRLVLREVELSGAGGGAAALADFD